MSTDSLLEENRILKERVRFLESRLHPTTQAAEVREVLAEERFSD